MFRRPLNNVALATTTHRKSERVSDGTGTKVKAQITNKCWIKMVQGELYNVKYPPCRGGGSKKKKKRRNTVEIRITLTTCLTDLCDN